MTTSTKIMKRPKLVGAQVASKADHNVALGRFIAQQNRMLGSVGTPDGKGPRKPEKPRTIADLVAVQNARDRGEKPSPPKKSKKSKGDRRDAMGHDAIGPIDMPPSAATPVFADAFGGQFTMSPDADGIRNLPFVSGRPMKKGPQGSEAGGFMPLDGSSQPRRSSPAKAALAKIMSALPQRAAQDWLTGAAASLMTVGMPGNPLGNALKMIAGPSGFAGPLGGGMSQLASSFAESAVGQLADMLPSLGSLVGNEKLGGVVDTLLSDYQPSELAKELFGSLTAGDPADALNELANSISGIIDGSTLAAAIDDLKNLSPSDIASAGLDKAADYLMDQWSVDDESSAAETVANMLVDKYKDKILGALKDPGAFIGDLKAFFAGVCSTACLPAAFVCVPDDKSDVIATGFPQVLVHDCHIARINDMMMPSGKPILEGSATVLSGGMPTSRFKSQTAIPSMITDSKATVLVGGPSLVLPPPAPPPSANPPSNAGPAGPAAPSTSQGASDTPPVEGAAPGQGPPQAPGESTEGTAGGQPAEAENAVGGEASEPGGLDESPEAAGAEQKTSAGEGDDMMELDHLLGGKNGSSAGAAAAAAAANSPKGASAPSAKKSWTVDGVKNTMSKTDPQVIDAINNNNIKITSFDTAYDSWQDDKTGAISETELTGLRGNTVRNPKEIRIRKSLSDEEATETLYHEMSHTSRGRPQTRDESLQQEIDVRVDTEKFAIRQGRPETGKNYRTSNGKVNRTVIENQIKNSKHYNPKGRKRVGRRYEGEKTTTGW